jgi:hypothetical protein
MAVVARISSVFVIVASASLQTLISSTA